MEDPADFWYQKEDELLMRRKAYIYPITAYEEKIIPNPYLENLMNSFSHEVDFVNMLLPSNKGILDLVKFYKKIDLLFLNWIEDLPDKKGGLVQVLFFIILVRLLKGRKVPVIWTMHNKLSHYHTHTRVKKFMFRFLIRRCDFIITHSTEGIRYAGEYGVRNYARKMRYFPHPLENRMIKFKESPVQDILIWGSVIPYKNIDGFLSYLHENGMENRYRIRIFGKVKPSEYEEVIKPFCNSDIILDNRYIPQDELEGFVAESRTIIFTHAGESVLSSGALMDSLSYGATVFGPHIAAFRDAYEAGLIQTFQSFGELVELLDQSKQSPRNQNELIAPFINENNWSQFAKKALTWIKEEEKRKTVPYQRN
jgi:beta-1,4-mannosyltransferase